MLGHRVGLDRREFGIGAVDPSHDSVASLEARHDRPDFLHDARRIGAEDCWKVKGSNLAH